MRRAVLALCLLLLMASGHARKRGAGWVAMWSVEVDGSRKQKQRSGFPTKKAAESHLADVLSSLNRDTYVEPSRMTVAEYVREWLAGLPSEGLEPGTIANYKSNSQAHIIPHLGHIPLQKLSPTLIKAFYADLLEGGRRDGKGGLSPRTVNLVATALGKALKTATAHRLILSNPAREVRKPRPRRVGSGMKTWSGSQLRSFLESVSTDRLYPLWLTAASTGMRRSEVLGLRWQDVDLDKGRLAIRQTIVLVDSHPIVNANPKSGRGRSIALDDVSVAGLRAWRKHQIEERLAWGSAYQDTGLVFTREYGTLLHPERISRRFEAHAKASGLPMIRFHDLRHTHATLLLEAGVHPKVVQERLGHSSISITLDTYSHVIPAMQEDAAQRVANLVFGTS